ncbi:MAG: cyclopropane-fatty-acyl-phospholipid synthase family protein [Pseudomonadota bacterium]
MRFLPAFFKRVIKRGQLTLHAPDGFRESYGDPDEGPSVEIEITDPSLDWRMMLNPELKAPEAYMDGTLKILTGGAYEFLTLVYINKPNLDKTPNQIFFNKIDRALRRAYQHNPIARARKNVGHHYDLGNEFYRLWLDEDMQYSCGYFPTGKETLAEGQLLKKRHIASKLGLQPGQRVLDIGCGWGGMALYLARTADVHVTGVTLSTEQLEIAKQRARDEGLEDKVSFQLRDYRDVTETYDRIVSVGMLEHVGVNHLEQYFLNVRDRLAPDGVALIHTISTKAPPGITGPFIRKYIFPGGYAPCVSEAALAIERSGLWMLDCEIWRVHYGHTLRHWRETCLEKRDEIIAMYDERFFRMWEFYLAASQCVFEYGSSHVAQFQLGRERDAMPLTRDYISKANKALKAAGG